MVGGLEVPKSGELLGFPTETVWGLGALPDRAGWEAIMWAKGRDPGQALQVSNASAALALEWAADPQQLQPLTPFWPGPLTLVVQARSGLPEYLAPGGWVGLRVPAHPVALAVLTAAGGRLLTTSLNRSGEPTVTSEAGARALGLADTVLGDGGQPPSGAASTVLRVGPDTLEVLRAGEITPSALQASLRGTPLADRALVTR